MSITAKGVLFALPMVTAGCVTPGNCRAVRRIVGGDLRRQEVNIVNSILTTIFGRLEKKDYNNGVCRNCGIKLKQFDVDSQGGRGYICERCGHTVWVSWNVDGRG